MASSWDHLGELGNVGQLAGVDAIRLIGMIVKAASTARMHKRNCRQFAQHLKLIGNLLEQLKISELKRYPETREPLEQLEDSLRRSYILVNSCQDRSFLYLLAMGWNIVYQFRKAQVEIDRYLRLVPLITLVDNARVREKLEYIERDECQYTFDEEETKVQAAILNPDPCSVQKQVLKKTLSCSYPKLCFNEALRKENEKLQLELQRSQVNMDVGQCEVIQHLIGVTETIASSIPENSTDVQNSNQIEANYLDASSYMEDSYDGSYDRQQSDTNTVSRSVSTVSSGHDLISNRGSQRYENWNTDLLGCCSEPCLCIKTFFYPCGTLSRVASVAKSKQITEGEACNDLFAYTLIFSCCCYTCCIRRKLRSLLHIKGGLFDDFLSHLMCCCCALVQESREVDIRGAYGPQKTKVNPPPSQYMVS